MDYTNKKIMEKLENDSLEPQDLRANTKPVSQKKKKSSNAEFKRKYFEYYDDVKTNIKEDW